jgi:hypothetical protein
LEVFFAPFEEATAAVGRFRNVRQAEEVRQRLSGDSLIAWRYSSSPRRRSSRKLWFETVFENQDFEGRGTGGGSLVWVMREA